MKVISRKSLKSGFLLQEVGFGINNTVGDINGTVSDWGAPLKNSIVIIYNKSNILPIAVRKSDSNGKYSFKGLNNSLNCFVVAFDLTKKYNAVIQDNIVPK